MKKSMQKKAFKNKNSITRMGKTLFTAGVIVFLVFVAFTCKKPKDKDCVLDLTDYNTKKEIAIADSIKVVNYFGSYKDSAPRMFKDVVEFFMNEEKLTEEKALERAFLFLRKNSDGYDEATKNYVKTYWGLVDAFEISKKSRDDAYKTANDDYEKCLSGK